MKESIKVFDYHNLYWRQHRAHCFEVEEAALYYLLIQLCNEKKWVNPFPMRLDMLLSTLNISENRFKSARENLEKVGMLRTVMGRGRGNHSLFFLPNCRILEDENEYFTVFSDAEKASQNPSENPLQNPLQNPSENPLVKGSVKPPVKGSVKPPVKGSVKDLVKPSIKGSEFDPFYKGFNEGFNEDFYEGFNEGVSYEQEGNETELEAATKQGLQETTTSKTNATITKKTGLKNGQENGQNFDQISASPFKEGEGEGEITTTTSSISARVREIPKSDSHASKPSQSNVPAREEILAYAEQLRTMQGMTGATEAVALKFWNHYSSTAPPWHTSPKTGQPKSLTDWRKKLRDWAIEERSNTNNGAVYTLNVHDVPQRLRSVANFGKVWSNYLEECIRLDAPHSKTSAFTQLQFLEERINAGEDVLTILNTAIRNQTSKLYAEQRPTNGNTARSLSNTGGIANGHSGSGSTTARKPSSRKPQPEANTQKESITIS